VHPDFHFHARPEAIGDRNHAIDGEASEIRIADTGEVGCRNPGAGMSRARLAAIRDFRLRISD
jgi:hypothetical protein